MDWYFDSVVNDLVVPQNTELFERFSSPESWLNWGISDSKNLVGLDDEYLVTDAALEYKELDFNGKSPCSEVDKDQSSGSSVCGGGYSEEIMMQSTVLGDQCDQLNYQLRGLSALEEMDDIFLSCVPGIEDPNSMLEFSPEPQCGMIPADNFFPDTTLDSQSMSSDMQSTKSSKYLKRHAFSPPVGWEKGDITCMQFTPYNSGPPDCQPMKALKGKAAVPSERNRTNGYKDNESSPEESILHDLKTVMAKLPENTRICFRDALYRLANNSKQHIIQSQDGDLGTRTTAPDEKLRWVEKGEMEAKTNTIDRAIGILMFKNTDFNATSLNSDKETAGGSTPVNYCSSLQQISTLLPHVPFSQCNSEVPIFGQRDSEVSNSKALVPEFGSKSN